MTNNRILFILVEGSDDERFFQTVIQPIFEKQYNIVKIWKYAEEKTRRVNDFLKSIKQMNATYIYVRDMDNNPCVTSAKQLVISNGRNVDNDKIMIINKEIECWYMAGLTMPTTKRLKISHKGNTDNFSKEQFNESIPKKFHSRIDFLIELLKNFSISQAKRKNKSFDYFLEKYLSEKI